MSRFTRFLRVILLPVAVLAIIAGSSASASAATLDLGVSLKAPATISLVVHPDSMNY